MSTKQRIKRFAPLQLGLMLGGTYVLFSLLLVPFFLIAAAVGAFAPAASGSGPSTAPTGAIMAGLGIGMALAIPVLYGILGFIGGVIAAWIYNFVARFVGGIEVEVE